MHDISPMANAEQVGKGPDHPLPRIVAAAILTSNNVGFPCDLPHDYAYIHKVNL